MHLKSLTLRGFKSFASATTLRFEPGITCVVGPNGSGKSNVVDALSWVMGEQGAKTLRGGKMEDVIFAGTSGRAPLGRAEVQLTIDNTDGALPIDYTEVTISRTMFRNGGSDYAINGHSARLLDVQELLSDSGIGREMHVIVGQGQLDSILNATPETRRGFIEEAAGVLKHRKRKEKAQRKLDATAVNLNRLADLLAELRRQLKPLGRQAEVARRAAVVQAELRDAQARLLADDYASAAAGLASDTAAEAELVARRRGLENELAAVRDTEQLSEAAAGAALPRLTQSQETWYALAGLAERIRATASIASERLRVAQTMATQERPGRDPEAIEREATAVRDAEAALREEVAQRSADLSAAAEQHRSAQEAWALAEKTFQTQQRAIADRREGLARLTGEVNTLRGRSESAAAEVERLVASRQAVAERAEAARRGFATLETRLVSLGAGEPDLDEAYETAAEAVAALESQGGELQAALTEASSTRAALQARVDALGLSLDRKDATGALLAATEVVPGLLGPLAARLTVADGAQAAIAAALGAAADALTATSPTTALEAFTYLKAADLGRAGLVLHGSAVLPPQPSLPEGARYAGTAVECDQELRASVDRLLHQIVLVTDLDQAARLVADHPALMAVTPEGDLLSSWFAAGGSHAAPSLLEVKAAHDAASEELTAVTARAERIRFALAEWQTALSSAVALADAALARLHESDAEHAGLAEEAAELNQAARSAQAERGRIDTAIDTARLRQTQAALALEALQERLDAAQAQPDSAEADPQPREAAGSAARVAAAAEMEARLALRTVEERARAVAGRADSLTRAAQAERQARAQAAARAEQARREAQTAQAVLTAASWLGQQVAASLDLAHLAREAAQAARSAAEADLSAARIRSRELAQAFEQVVSLAHRDELARAQTQMMVESLAEKAMNQLGLEPEALLAEYGPDLAVPVLVAEDGTPITEESERPAPRAYVRAEQEKRLHKAERDLGVLGKVNPLALEEFDALQQRHGFLSEQLEDLRRTRADLADIISEVDARVQEVFAQAYADVELAFADSFSRLFPGGEGRLVLTEPGQWLTTGVEVEARPAGKLVKRLSLLSGGERSLVAVAFLVALFKARPSPFYILDEVEAALDDTNLGRLLEIYEELRDTSQLLVITHQKRTMEIADALYGVTMRGDGVSTVISQRMRES